MSEYYDVEKIKYDKRSKLWLVKFVGYDEPELTLYKDLSEYYQSIYYKNGKLKPHEIKRRRKEAAERRKPVLGGTQKSVRWPLDRVST